MADFKPKTTEIRSLAVHALPQTLLSLCCKTILVQENYRHSSLCQAGIDKYNELNVNNKLSVNIGADGLTRNHSIIPEIGNCDTDTAPEYVNLNKVNTKEWIDIEDFDNFIHQSIDDFENYLPTFQIRGVGNLRDTYTKANNNEAFDKDFVTDSCLKVENLKAITAVNNEKLPDANLIVLSSTDESDFEFSLPDDIDSISLNSIESYEQSLQNKNTKVTVEVSPQIQYINSNIASVTKDTKKLPCKESNEILPKVKETPEKFTIISLSSDEYDDDSNDTCSGYNSSDFEFITEEEAKSDGLINYKKTKVPPGNGTFHTIATSSQGNTAQCSQMARPANSGNNNEDYRQNHIIPAGEDYFNLFRGMYAPTMPWFNENKSMGLLETEYSGLGFDIRVLSRQIRENQPDTDEYKKEADECAKKILNMYSRENRKRR